ncbi:hypothetical protein D9611_001880 [Ephemerocybe angulata]|uniref:F-box domain-containing protein n=1 Tax=Ephemerocybe angulata TaxID=980116 RepID=A0A8H5CIM1_9AGAR|nr:hypothetical protein D9611_001880 [Tulosesus angulatus]
MDTPPILDHQELCTRINNWVHHGRRKDTYPPPPSMGSSPISELPLELLSEIFLFCLPEEKYPTPSPTTAPMLLMHVCQAWRRVARHTQELWSTIHLNYRSLDEDVPATGLWLSYSGEAPLSLSLSIDFNERPHQSILNLLCRYAHRWKHVRFEFRHLSCPQVYNLAHALDNVPMLSTFEFRARDVSTSNIAPITQLLSTAPHLKELTWVDDMADTETLLALPLPRLSRLSLSMNYGRLDYLELLDQCENLEYIRLTRPSPDILPSQTPRLLTKLTSLNIARDITGILNHLILPSLKHVRVHLDADSSEDDNDRYSRLGVVTPAIASQKCWDPKDLIQLIERSSCQVESLWINTPVTDDDLLACLQACDQSLKSLTVRGKQPCSALVEMLTPRRAMLSSLSASSEDMTCLCPRLSELVIDIRIPNSCSLVELVERRAELASQPDTTISPFNRLRLHYPAGHKDIPILRHIAIEANAKERNSMDLTIMESRTGNLRGSSAGRTGPYLYRRNISSSR